MAIGFYTDLYESALTPWTTLGPLALVITFSLLVEGSSDYKRHLNDQVTNVSPCVVLRRSDEIENDETAERDDSIIKGKDVVVNINKAYYNTTSGPKDHHPAHKSDVNSETAINVHVGFEKVRRMDIRQGHFILVKNREMVPADMLLLASSNDQGSAYIETSSIDGETNLKLRTRASIPKRILKLLREGNEKNLQTLTEEDDGENRDDTPDGDFETIAEAVKRITRFSYLGRPEGQSALDHPLYGEVEDAMEEEHARSRRSSRMFSSFRRNSSKDGNFSQRASSDVREYRPAHRIGRASIALAKSVKNFNVDLPKYAPRRLSAINDGRYISALTTEPPNPSVHTFQGKLTLPPFENGAGCVDVPLGADNVILRGAVIRNTQWVIGVAFFTGNDTKLVQNSFDTPSKFSQLDILMNYTVAAILFLMIVIVSVMATLNQVATKDEFDQLFYIGLNANETETWPYLPDTFEAPDWQTKKDNWIQVFFLYITLLNQFIPLSLYITVEIVTFCMLYFINSDLDMYDNTTNTRAVARSTIVTDLGRVQYIFSDKTGTLTQNVMRFRRCSVDGIAFGAPIQKKRPGAENEPEDEEETSPWLPLRHLLVGQIKNDAENAELSSSEKLTFNAEMFIRILCLCHTVVVEKDLDKKKTISAGSSSFGGSAAGSSLKDRLFRRRKKESFSEGGEEGSKASNGDEDESNVGGKDESLNSASSIGLGEREEEKSADGAPEGFAYQAESPDEGALVSAASINYGFQVRSRDSNGITIRVPKPSHFEDKNVVKGLKSGNLSMKKLAADTSEAVSADTPQKADYPDPSKQGEQRDESWAILAVNKFDSDRKRMSILLRSPPELGSLPILFCKGADSSMLDPDVCASSSLLKASGDDEGGSSLDVSALTTIEDDGDDEVDGDVGANENELSCMLGMQSQLGDFASEGLRTLVLGLRILTEKECEDWLAQYNAAAVSLTDREKLLTEAGLAIEKKLHIAGATAIEDKLQVGVPDTIANLAKAGIKLWVLTGDKRETAVEIGYSTAVLTPKMSVTEVGDLGVNYVRTQMAMEFMRLVKKGKLPEYQKTQLEGEGPKSMKQRWADFKFNFGKCMRSFGRMLTSCWASFLALLGFKSKAERKREILLERLEKEVKIVPENVRRRRVRDRADKVIHQWLDSNEAKKYRRPKKQKSENELITESAPKVFQRASSARSLLGDIRSSGKLTSSDIRRISLVHRAATVDRVEEEDGIVDMDTLSLDSHFPGNKDDLAGNFDKKRRTLLERAFAVDRSVRKGHLTKHVHPHKLDEKASKAAGMRSSLFNPRMSDGPKALVIEGAALKHLLGDDELEEILFACAKVCDAVIACRVSPKQKAELVNLVRHNVHPTPITLAIGDGANDVGMIQEAHVGVGISGKEGTQAVNASDFAISQFRFLESLVLIHGRWDFFRLSTVVLYSFYKNAVQSGIMVIYNFRTIFSGQPVFDQWLIASLNFVCGAPIIMTGLFDRCLSKEYVKNNPEVYTASRDNEMITIRTLTRWVIMAIIHMFTLYLFTVGPSNEGGGITPAPSGLMRNNSDDRPGDGEGGDYRSVGTTMFTSLVILMAYKVLFESKSLVHGRWPAITCSKANDSFLNRLAYTWIGVSWLSVGFYFIFISAYQLVGRASSNPTVGQFADIANHVLGTRSINWMLFFFVPIFGIVFDIVFKVFSNMFYPTQTQIHMEIEAVGKRDRKRKERRAKREEANAETPEQVTNV